MTTSIPNWNAGGGNNCPKCGQPFAQSYVPSLADQSNLISEPPCTLCTHEGHLHAKCLGCGFITPFHAADTP